MGHLYVRNACLTCLRGLEVAELKEEDMAYGLGLSLWNTVCEVRFR